MSAVDRSRGAPSAPDAGAGQILVAGIGNAWLQDDGFGGAVARRLEQRTLPAGVTVLDAGTGGLDLAYEVMRGYEALVLLDVSRQGGAPGSLYVIEPEPEEVGGQLEDGERIDPHGMDPLTVLRFVKLVGGWPGKVVVIACEPSEVEEVGLGLTAAVGEAVERAVELVLATLGRLRSAAGSTGAGAGGDAVEAGATVEASNRTDGA